MAYVVNQYKILKRIRDRLDIRDPTAEDKPPTELSPVIIMVSDVDVLLREIELDSITVDISAASGYTTLATVPAGKRWLLHALKIPGTTAATSVIVATAAANVQISASGTSYSLVQFHGGIPLKENWALQAANTNNGGDSSRNFGIIYEEEDAF